MTANMQVQKVTSQDGKPQLQVTEPVTMPAWDAGTQLSVVGKPQPRVEGAEKVTGRARYTYDVRLSGQLYARVLRSPHPHARLTRIDTTRAAALPGVHAVLSSANAPDISWYADSKLFDT